MPYRWKHIKYFVFLAWNWGLPLAIFVLRHEIRGEKKYHSLSAGVESIKQQVSSFDWLHGSIYQPINFFIAEKLFNQLSEADITTSFLDAGCGKGRAMAIAAHYGFSEIYGFDVAPNLCAIAAKEAKRWQQYYPTNQFHLSCGKAQHYTIPKQIGVIFLFNPFDNVVMMPFIAQVMASLQQHPRKMQVLYANPVCKESWLEAGFTEIYHIKKLQYLEGVVLQWLPE